MGEARRSFTRRVDEVNLFFNFLVALINDQAKIMKPDGTGKGVSVPLSSTLKSTAFLLLYNLIESTVYNALLDIHDALNSSGLKYHDLNEKIQIKWLEYQFGNSNTGITSISRSAIAHVLGNNVIEIDLDRYLGMKNLFSGNLDARKIREVFSQYDCIIRQHSEGSKLVEIKNMRNKLAHGELSFSDGGKDVLLSDMMKIKSDAIKYMDKVVDEVAEYIKNKNYTNPNVSRQTS